MANIGGSFVNPAYASPEQIKQLRAYAEQLQKEAIGGESKHWIGAIAQGLMGYQGAKKMREADVEEQKSNREFAKELMDATASKDPAKLMEVMSNPRAAPVQALLARQLLEWGPGQRITTPGGLSVEQPVPPWFGGTPVPTQKITPSAPTVPPAVQPPIPPASPVPGAPNAETSSVGDIVPGSRTTTGSPDSAFDALGNRMGIPNLGALNTAGMKQATELEYQKTAASKRAEQDVAAGGTKEIVGDIKKTLQTDIPDTINFIDKNPTSTTGRVAWMGANVVGSPAHAAAERLRKIEAAALQHEIQTVENAEKRMVKPQEAEAMRVRLGLSQMQDYPDLRYNLEQLRKRFSGGETGSRQGPVNMTPQPGQAQAEPGRDTAGFKILKVRPPLGQ